MAQKTQEVGLSPERIKDVKEKHAAIDPGCVNLSPDEIVKWHPIGGISWEERARRMKEAGIVETNK